MSVMSDTLGLPAWSVLYINTKYPKRHVKCARVTLPEENNLYEETMVELLVPGDEQTPSRPSGPTTSTRLRNRRMPVSAKLDFPFFNISHPSEIRSTQHRKQVRSRVTWEQHRRRKKHFTAESSVSPPEQTYKTEYVVSQSPAEPAEDSSELALKGSWKFTPPSSNESSPDIPNNSLKPVQATQLYAVPHPKRSSIGGSDPFACYSVHIPWEPWYDGLLHYMLTVFAPRAWPSLQITNKQGWAWERFMTQHAMAEPALLYVRLLFASGELIKVGVLKREHSYSLQSKAITAINEALSDPERSISDGMILAVGRIALHESIYGNRTAAMQIHRPAQRRMIDMRGGMKALDFPDLVKKLMRWADKMMSVQGNTDRLLPDDEDLNNDTYDMQQSLEALEAWEPVTGRALRGKVAAEALQNK